MVADTDHVIERFSARVPNRVGAHLSMLLLIFFGSPIIALPVGPGLAFIVPYHDSILSFPFELEHGELVITTLSKEAMPIIRYRTHDITHVIPEPCACGRSLRRIARISRRSDDMLIIRGVNVFPSQIEAALLKVEKTLPHYQIIVRRDRNMDEMEIRIEVTAELFSDRVSEIERIAARLSHAVENTTGIHAKISLVEPKTIERSEGKARRVVDLRNLNSPKP